MLIRECYLISYIEIFTIKLREFKDILHKKITRWVWIQLPPARQCLPPPYVRASGHEEGHTTSITHVTSRQLTDTRDRLCRKSATATSRLGYKAGTSAGAARPKSPFFQTVANSQCQPGRRRGEKKGWTVALRQSCRRRRRQEGWCRMWEVEESGGRCGPRHSVRG